MKYKVVTAAYNRTHAMTTRRDNKDMTLILRLLTENMHMDQDTYRAPVRHVVIK